MIINPDKKFSGLVASYQEWAAQAAAAEAAGDRVTWYRPPGLAGLDNRDDIAACFSREQVNAEMKKAFSEGAKTGEIVAGTVQIDYLAVAGRAFANRHASPLRSVAHSLSRRRGHGQSNGPFSVNAREFVLATLREATSAP